MDNDSESMVFGGFRVEQSVALGTGKQGSVYKAVCEREVFPGVRVGEVVALKVIPEAEADDVSFLRLKRRVDELASVDHPCVVRYFGCFREPTPIGANDVVVLEFLEGQTLRDRLRCRPHGLPLDQALDIAVQFVDALSHLADRGIIHRDVKPGNVFLCRDGSVKLIDFGVAKRENGQTATTLAGNMVGTFDYMAPDYLDAQFLGDVQSDIFSVGVCLYEMLSGRLPFPKLTRYSGQPEFSFLTRWGNLKGEGPIRISRAVSERCPLALPVLEKAMSPNRAVRYADYPSLLDDLLLVRNGRSVVQVQPHSRKTWPWILLTALLSFGSAALLDFVSWRPSSPQPEPQPASAPVSPSVPQSAPRPAAQPVRQSEPQPVSPRTSQPRPRPEPPSAPPSASQPRPQSEPQSVQKPVLKSADMAVAKRDAEEIVRDYGSAELIAADIKASCWISRNVNVLPNGQFALWTNEFAVARAKCQQRQWIEDARIGAIRVVSAYQYANELEEGDRERDAWLQTCRRQALPQSLIRDFADRFDSARTACEKRVRRVTAMSEADSVTNDAYRVGAIAQGDVKVRKWKSSWRRDDLPPGVYELCLENFAKAKAAAEPIAYSSSEYADIKKARQTAAAVETVYLKGYKVELGDERRGEWMRRWLTGGLPTYVYADCIERIDRARKVRRIRDCEAKIQAVRKKWAAEVARCQQQLEAALRPGSYEDPTVMQVRLFYVNRDFDGQVRALQKMRTAVESEDESSRKESVP